MLPWHHFDDNNPSSVTNQVDIWENMWQFREGKAVKELFKNLKYISAGFDRHCMELLQTNHEWHTGYGQPKEKFPLEIQPLEIDSNIHACTIWNLSTLNMT